MTPVRTNLLAAFAGLVYAVVLAARGDEAAGLVGGVLLAILVALVIRRVRAHNAVKRRRAATHREHPPG
jgi:hypothetical protein